FFLVPALIVFKISLSQPAVAQPPYVPTLDFAAGVDGFRGFVAALSFENYRLIVSDSLYLSAYLRSLEIAGLATAMLLGLGLPFAYAMTRTGPRTQMVLLMLVILPFWTAFLIRVYAWMTILQRDGLLNQMLTALGLTDTPASWLASDTAVFIGLVYSYLPFMVLPIYASLERIDRTLLEAAADLGATPTRAFWRITVPLAMPGVVAGALICFIPIVGEFVIPDLLGDSSNLMIGQTLWTEFFANRDWPLAAAVAMVMLVVLIGPIVAYEQMQSRALKAREG
ncbi:MAG: ABC transporter permease subunit, partial [Rhizobiales bacterium]|nr:ABC transporter permease subunit [Hyphomicrobiales bacterium]